MHFPVSSPQRASCNDTTTPFGSLCGKIEGRFSWTLRVILWAVFFQILCLSYVPSIRGPFIYDDIEGIVANPDLRRPMEPWRVFSDHETSLHFDRRPVAGLLTLVDFQLWRENPTGYRMTNLFTHFACGMAIAALAALVSRKMESRLPMLFGHVLAFIWLLHPLATNSVSFIFQRSEILMSLFFVLALYCMLRSYDTRRPTAWLCMTLACSFCSALSKENGLTLLMALPLFAGVCGPGSWRGMFVGRKLFFAIFFIGLAAIAIWVRTGVRFTELDQSRMALNGSWAYFKYQCPVVVHYLKLVVFPYPLCFLPRYLEVPMLLDFLPYFMGLVAVSVLLIFRGVHRPWMWLCLGGFLIILAPTSSFIPIPLEPEAEFRMYLPSAFVLAGLLAWLGGLALRSRLPRFALPSLLGLILMAEVVTTMARNATYSSALSLWKDCTIKAPANGKSWANLGFSHVELGDHENARLCAEKLLFWGKHQNSPDLIASGEDILVSTHLAKGEPEVALALLGAVSAERSALPTVQLYLAHALAACGKPAEALAILRRIYPDARDGHPFVARLYGGIYSLMGLEKERKEMEQHLYNIHPGLKILDLAQAKRSGLESPKNER